MEIIYYAPWERKPPWKVFTIQCAATTKQDDQALKSCGPPASSKEPNEQNNWGDLDFAGTSIRDM